MKSVIKVDNLSHSYGERCVLKKLTFNVSLRNFFVIIGPNASGKTTLIRLVLGLEKANSGKISILGYPLQSYSNKQLAQIMAYVPQKIPIDFPFTVSQVVHMGRAPYLGLLGIPGKKDTKIVMKSMEFTGITELAKRKVCQLSGGEQQRVFLARAICQEPRVIVLDEPTTALDIFHKIRIMDIMERLVKEKEISIFMVLHDINLAAMYSDNLLLMKSGLIVKEGSAKEVLNFSLLQDTYECPVFVDDAPLKGIPRITPIPGRYFKN